MDLEGFCQWCSEKQGENDVTGHSGETNMESSKSSIRIPAVGRLRQGHHGLEARLRSYWEFVFKKERFKLESNYHIIEDQLVNTKTKVFPVWGWRDDLSIRTSIALAEDLNSATNNLLSQLTTFWNSRSKGSNTCGLQRHLNSCAHTPPHTHIHVIKNNGSVDLT